MIRAGFEQILKIQQDMGIQRYDISSPHMSYAEVASLHLKELRKKMPTFVMPVTEGPPICPENDLHNLVAERENAKSDAAVAHESYLCWQMTPWMSVLFEGFGIVVNSEDYRWLQTYLQEKQNFMKPDFFVTLCGLMERRESSGFQSIKRLRNASFHFGVMPWKVRDCMRVLIEFKNKLCPEHFGKLIIYLQHLSRDSPGCVYYGMLCDDRNIILASCCDSVICTRYELEWSTPGSLQFVRNFVSPMNDWMELLDRSMSALEVRLYGDAAFLGMGRNGRVFKVQQEASLKVLALKIVLSSNNEGLANSAFAEHFTLLNLKAKNLPVVSVLEDAVCIYREVDGHCLGVCYLMEEIGTPVTVDDVLQLRAVFALLFSLHRQSQFHGDPRLANIISVENRLLWIDFFVPHFHKSSPDNLNAHLKHDIETLASSLPKLSVSFCDAQYEAAVSTYADEPSEVSLGGILQILERCLLETTA